MQGLNGDADIGEDFEDSESETLMSICASSQSLSDNSQHTLLQFNLIYSTYLIPEHLHKINRTY